MKLLYLEKGDPDLRLWSDPFEAALREIGAFTRINGCRDWPESATLAAIRGTEVLLTGWSSLPVPSAIAADPGRLRYICHLTGTLAGMLPIEILRAGIPVTNWGDTPADEIAEGTLTLLLACLKNLRGHTAAREQGAWQPPEPASLGSMRGLHLGLYGYGVIGRRFREVCRPLGPEVRVFDPFVESLPADTTRAESLDDLFDWAEAVSLHAGLTPQTRGSVTADLLRRLPPHGIVINTARGDLIEQEALFDKLASGRLRAGLDVLAGNDRLPPDHPALSWPNLLLTGHAIGRAAWPPRPGTLNALQQTAIDNLRRFARGAPLLHCMTVDRYLRST
ncbi:MAG: hypothetical protein EA425_11085 [Puniceicoccaceae bacterium]|nr:MAG: hypothetical protein EA425_11085 [Puniceicoccaceae bacterium]